MDFHFLSCEIWIFLKKPYQKINLGRYTSLSFCLHLFLLKVFQYLMARFSPTYFLKQQTLLIFFCTATRSEKVLVKFHPFVVAGGGWVIYSVSYQLSRSCSHYSAVIRQFTRQPPRKFTRQPPKILQKAPACSLFSVRFQALALQRYLKRPPQRVFFWNIAL